MSAYRYAYEIAFQGNDGSTYGLYARPENRFRSHDSAVVEARSAEGCGRSYGAFPRKVRVSHEDYALAR